MELQGPEQYRDSFAKEILRFNRGGIVSAQESLSILEPSSFAITPVH
jgi:hypothetical protein